MSEIIKVKIGESVNLDEERKLTMFKVDEVGYRAEIHSRVDGSLLDVHQSTASSSGMINLRRLIPFLQEQYRVSLGVYLGNVNEC